MSKLIYLIILEDMFPTLTSFERDLNNPYINRSITSGTSISSLTQLNPNPYFPSTQTMMPTSSKLLVSNLPMNFNEEAVKKLLKTFGKIKFLEMIKDPITGNYSGQCHVEFDSEQATAKALHCKLIQLILDIMGIKLQDNILYIKRSSGLVPTYSIPNPSGHNTSLGMISGGMNINLPNMSAEDYIKFREGSVSRVIMIKKMVTMKELEDDDEYDELYDDVMEECKNYGKVISVKIPRPEEGTQISGLGKVFVEYATRDGASFAREHLNGKNFHGRFVEVVFHPEDMYKRNQLE